MTELDKAACKSLGTGQCAAICLSFSSITTSHDCPAAELVWTKTSIAEERQRRPDGP